MPIDPDAEELVPMKDAPALFPGGERPSRMSIYKWLSDGLRGPKIKLDHIKVGGKLYTSRAAVERFLAATNGADRTAT